MDRGRETKRKTHRESGGRERWRKVVVDERTEGRMERGKGGKVEEQTRRKAWMKGS